MGLELSGHHFDVGVIQIPVDDAFLVSGFPPLADLLEEQKETRSMMFIFLHDITGCYGSFTSFNALFAKQ